MAEFDFARAAALMDILHKVATIAPKAASIMGLAQAELDAMNNTAKDIARDNAEAQAKAEADAKAKAEAAKPKAIPSDSVTKPATPTAAPTLADNARRL